MNPFRRKKHNDNKVYSVSGLVGNQSKMIKTLTRIDKTDEIIYINDFFVLSKNKNIKGNVMKNDNDELKFIVKELPNNKQRIEDMLNAMFYVGYKIAHMNDYSVVFERMEKDD